MKQTREKGKVQQKIVDALSRMLGVAPESIKADAQYKELLSLDPDLIRAFAVQIERVLGVMVGDSVFDAHPTVAELAAYCSAQPVLERGERRYIVVCRMPDGSTCERIYAARGHEKAAQQAMDAGAEAVLAVEREDAEDVVPRKLGFVAKVVVPLFVGVLLAGSVFVFIWWRRGFQRFW